MIKLSYEAIAKCIDILFEIVADVLL